MTNIKYTYFIHFTGFTKWFCHDCGRNFYDKTQLDLHQTHSKDTGCREISKIPDAVFHIEKFQLSKTFICCTSCETEEPLLFSIDKQTKKWIIQCKCDNTHIFKYEDLQICQPAINVLKSVFCYDPNAQDLLATM